MSTTLKELSRDEQRLLAVTGVLLHQLAASELHSQELRGLYDYITTNQPLMRLLATGEVGEADRDITLQAIFGVAVALDEPAVGSHNSWSIGIAAEAGKALALLQAGKGASAVQNLRAIGSLAVAAHNQCCSQATRHA